jgi:hypothetical protein
LLFSSLLALAASGPVLRVPLFRGADVRAAGPYTVAERLEQYGAVARARLAPFFARAKVRYPPAKLTLAYFKQERRLDLYARGRKGTPAFVRSYQSTAASGVLGPKLREGDLQVPEGFYKFVFLNANSRFHLSLRVNYPNAEDKARARQDRRAHLGGDIMIHGNAVSIGCVAMGDEAAEDLFVLVADTGMANVDLLLSPVDFRASALPADFQPPTAWTGELHGRLERALRAFPPPSAASR